MSFSCPACQNAFQRSAVFRHRKRCVSSFLPDPRFRRCLHGRLPPVTSVVSRMPHFQNSVRRRSAFIEFHLCLFLLYLHIYLFFFRKIVFFFGAKNHFLKGLHAPCAFSFLASRRVAPRAASSAPPASWGQAELLTRGHSVFCYFIPEESHSLPRGLWWPGGSTLNLPVACLRW